MPLDEEDPEIAELRAMERARREERGLPETSQAYQRKEEVNSILQRMISRHPSPDEIAEDYNDEVLDTVRQSAEQAAAEREKYLREARLAKWDGKVPEMWKGWSIDQLPRSFQRSANEWLATGFGSARNVVIWGGTGSGKTTLAYAISREVYAQGHKAKMWDIRELVAAINPKSSIADETIWQVKQAALLTIDDLGSEKKSEWTTERILEIIDYRWQWRKPTIVTTNLLLPTDDTPEGAETLKSHLGDRTFSRLMDNALFLGIKEGDRRDG